MHNTGTLYRILLISKCCIDTDRTNSKQWRANKEANTMQQAGRRWNYDVWVTEEAVEVVETKNAPGGTVNPFAGDVIGFPLTPHKRAVLLRAPF